MEYIEVLQKSLFSGYYVGSQRFGPCALDLLPAPRGRGEERRGEERGQEKPEIIRGLASYIFNHAIVGMISGLLALSYPLVSFHTE